jgi:integrase
MPRPPGVRWHKGAGCWTSGVGEVSEKTGRRRPIYFRGIPKNKPGEARAALARYLDEREARAGPTAADEPTMDELIQGYLSWLEDRVGTGKSKPVTYRGHVGTLEKFRDLEYAKGRAYRDKPASRMTATEMARTVEWLAAVDRGPGNPPGYAPNYIARIVSSVQAVLNWAATPLPGRDPERLIPANPIAKFGHEATRAPHSPDRYADSSEVRAFLDWGYARADAMGGLTGRFERLTMDLVKVSYLTGTRPGELRVAEWADFEPRGVRLEQLDQWWGRITLDPGRWKSGAKTRKPREVFLPPEAVGVIEAIRALPGHHPRFIWTHRRGNHAARRGAEQASHGEPWSDTALPNKICTLRRQAIAGGVGLEDRGHNRFVLYRLRHTRAADLLMAGVEIATVARLLGTSVAMIERTYSSFTSEHLAAAAGRGLGSLGRAVSPAPPAPE